MKRRDFLRTSSFLAAQVIGNSMVVTPALLKRGQAAAELPLASLRRILNSNEALVLIPCGTISLRCAGQALGTGGQLAVELSKSASVNQTVRSSKIATLPFLRAVQYFGGGSAYPKIQLKGKSDLLSARHERAQADWGGNFQRLKVIKDHIDQTNFFKQFQSISSAKG